METAKIRRTDRLAAYVWFRLAPTPAPERLARPMLAKQKVKRKAG
jgi:hypothetical protein